MANDGSGRGHAQGDARLVAEALQATLALSPNSEGQKTAQREIATRASKRIGCAAAENHS